MLDVKKKLSSFIPNSARAQLQNVLTVEWDTHKTVLVEVPGVKDRSGDMEMSGMDGGRRDMSNYGRLQDDEDETEGLFNQSDYSSSRPDWNRNTASSSRDQSISSKSKSKRPPPLAPRPDFAYQAEENPFDETSPTYRASIGHSEYQFGMPGTPDRKPKPKPTKNWATFETVDGGRREQVSKVGNPWGVGGEWSETPSPSSSRGTRESELYDAEDPFK